MQLLWRCFIVRANSACDFDGDSDIHFRVARENENELLRQVRLVADGERERVLPARIKMNQCMKRD